MKKVLNIGLCGIGSCASSLVQSLEFLKNGQLMHGIVTKDLGNYSLSDIKFSIAFDVDENKIGKDLSDAIFCEINKAAKYIDVKKTGITVEDGFLFDGLNGKLSDIIIPSIESRINNRVRVIERLQASKTDVFICYLPTGSRIAVQEYAKICSSLNIAFINATPEPVNNDNEIRESFHINNTPLFGDDIKSHVGATAIHSVLLDLLKSKGLKINSTYQLNIGGNTDFYNLSDSERSKSKFKSKGKALKDFIEIEDSTYAGPSGYVSFLEDTKICHLNIECESVLNSKLSIDLKLKVDDSPNSAGVILQAILLAGLYKDLKQKNPEEINSYLFKSPYKCHSKIEETLFMQKILNEYGSHE